MLAPLPVLAAELKAIRIADHPTHTRLVFQLDAAADCAVRDRHAPGEVRIDIEAVATPRDIGSRSVLIRRVEVRDDAGAAVARIQLAGEPSRVRRMVLEDPPRLVFDLMFPETQPVPVATEPAPEPRASEAPAIEPAPVEAMTVVPAATPVLTLPQTVPLLSPAEWVSAATGVTGEPQVAPAVAELDGALEPRAMRLERVHPVAAVPAAPHMFAAANPISSWAGADGFANSRDFKNQLSIDREIDGDLPGEMEIDADFVDRMRFSGKDLASASLGSLTEWERRTAGETRMKLGLFGNRLRTRARYGWSRREVPVEASDYGLGIDTNRVELDLAMQHRLDAVLWKSENLGFSLFGLHGRVGPDYKGAISPDQRDFFDRANRETLSGGGKLRVGPVQVKLSRSELTYGIADEDETRDGLVHKARLELGTHQLASLLSGSSWYEPPSLLPSSIYFSFSSGEIEPYAGAARRDASRDLSVGMWWYRDTWSAGVTLWRSSWDGRQPGEESADWQGAGGELGFEYYADRWDLQASIGASRSRNLEQWSRSADLSIDGSMAFSLRPEGLPDVTGRFSLNRYALDYLSWEARSRSDYWEAAATLDFSKYLGQLPARDRKVPALALTYRLARWGEDDGFGDRSTDLGHAFLLNTGFRF